MMIIMVNVKKKTLRKYFLVSKVLKIQEWVTWRVELSQPSRDQYQDRFPGQFSDHSRTPGTDEDNPWNILNSDKSCLGFTATVVLSLQRRIVSSSLTSPAAVRSYVRNVYPRWRPVSVSPARTHAEAWSSTLKRPRKLKKRILKSKPRFPQ